MASFRSRQGKCQARVRRHGYPVIEKTFQTRTEAEKWARQIESEIDRGLYVDRTDAERTLFRDVLQRYEAEALPLKRGKDAESLRLQALMKSALAPCSMAALTSKAIAAWRDSRLKQVSGSTVNRELNIISAVINVAIREWGIALPVNPVTLIKRPQSNRSRERRINAEEEHRLMEALTVKERADDGTFSGPQNIWMKPLVQFALETAMRRGELLALTWDEIDLERRVAYLPVTKNGEARAVPLSSRAVTILRSLPECITGRVFSLSADAVKKAFTRACTRAGIKGVVFHTLRHEATSRLADKLPNVIELAAVTGHRDLRMLQRYYHPRAEELARKLG